MGIRCLQSWEASLEVDVEERFQSHALQLVRGNHDQIWTSSVASPASSVLKWDHSLLLNDTDLKQKPEEKKTKTVSSRSRIPVLDSTHDGFTTQICTIGPTLLAQKNVGFSHQDQKFVSTTNQYTMGWLSLCSATNSLAEHNSCTLPQAHHWCCCWEYVSLKQNIVASLSKIDPNKTVMHSGTKFEIWHVASQQCEA